MSMRWILVFSLLLVAGCGAQPGSQPDASATAVVVEEAARPSIAPGTSESSPTPSPTPKPKPTDTPEPTDTPNPTASPTLPPTPTPTRTLISDELRQEAEATYKRIVFIQFNATDLAETARQRAAGEISALEAGLARLVTFNLIQLVEDFAYEAQPPAALETAWEKALTVHEETKTIGAQWFREEMEASGVAEGMISVLERADASEKAAAQVLIDQYGVDRASVEKLRLKTVEEVRALGSGTPTP